MQVIFFLLLSFDCVPVTVVRIPVLYRARTITRRCLLTTYRTRYSNGTTRYDMTKSVDFVAVRTQSVRIDLLTISKTIILRTASQKQKPRPRAALRKFTMTPCDFRNRTVWFRQSRILYSRLVGHVYPSKSNSTKYNI